MQIMTEEEYLNQNGAGRCAMGEAALHKNKNTISNKNWKKMVDRQASLDYKILVRREELRQEYADKVAKGLIRPPTRLERLEQKVMGHPDLESTQAAIRLLERMRSCTK